MPFAAQKRTSPTQRAVLRAESPDIFTGLIAAPAVQVYTVCVDMPFTAQITGFVGILSAGTATVRVLINGVVVNVLTGIALTTVENQTNVDAYDASTIAPYGSTLTVEVTAQAGSANMAFGVNYDRLN